MARRAKKLPTRKAKVSKGIVRMVWPLEITKKDGTKVLKELPHHYAARPEKYTCIVDVPDNVRPGWVWNGKEYAPRVKIYPKKWRSDLIEVLSERLGVSYDELMADVMQRKKDRKAV
jgi:hypothetical protein